MINPARSEHLFEIPLDRLFGTAVTAGLDTFIDGLKGESVSGMVEDRGDGFFVLAYVGLPNCCASHGHCTSSRASEGKQILQAAKQDYVVEEAILQLFQKLVDCYRIPDILGVKRTHWTLLRSTGIELLVLPVDWREGGLTKMKGSKSRR